MNDMLRNALVRYFMGEFDEDYHEAKSDAEHTVVGLAYTDVYDDEGNEHEIQVELHVPKKEVVYYVDGDDVGGESYINYEDIATDIDNNDFNSWFCRALDFCPEGWH